jgi:hypothetical protein
MIFHLSALSIILVIAFRERLVSCSLTPIHPIPIPDQLEILASILIRARTSLSSANSEPALSPGVLPQPPPPPARALPPHVARLSHYTPLQSFSFSDQAAAGLSSGNFDLEQNIGSSSGESRMGLDEAGVEEVRRIM